MAEAILAPEQRRPQKKLAKLFTNLIILSVAGFASFYIVQQNGIRLPTRWNTSALEKPFYVNMPPILVPLNESGSVIRIISHLKIEQEHNAILQENMLSIQDGINKDLRDYDELHTASSEALERIRMMILANVEKNIGAGKVDEVLITELLKS